MGFWSKTSSSNTACTATGSTATNTAASTSTTTERRGRSPSPAATTAAAATTKPARSTTAAPAHPIFRDAHVTTMDQVLGMYQFGQTLGKGAFSEVKQAKHRQTGQEVAVKIIDKASCAGKEGMIQTEVHILRQINHPNIIPLYDMYETENNILLVMQMVTGGELFESIVSRGKYTEHDAAQIICRIIQAVDYLHLKGIAHRDLKPENLLYSCKGKDAKIMISDFGLSKIFSDMDMMKTACGTPGYVAPEVLKRTGYGKEVDMWSIGVITYILLSGYPPFYEENNLALFQLIMKGQYKFDSPWWDDISAEAKDFVARLLIVDPRRRMMCKAALKHPFVRQHCGDVTEAITEECEESVEKSMPALVAPQVVVSAAPVPDKNLAPLVVDKLKKTIEDDRNSKGNMAVNAAEVLASSALVPAPIPATAAATATSRPKSSHRAHAPAVVTTVCAESSTSTAVSVPSAAHYVTSTSENSGSSTTEQMEQDVAMAKSASRSRSTSPARRQASIHEDTPEPRALKAKAPINASADSGLGDSVSLTAVNRLSISRLVIH